MSARGCTLMFLCCEIANGVINHSLRKYRKATPLSTMWERGLANWLSAGTLELSHLPFNAISLPRWNSQCPLWYWNSASKQRSQPRNVSQISVLPVGSLSPALAFQTAPTLDPNLLTILTMVLSSSRTDYDDHLWSRVSRSELHHP